MSSHNVAKVMEFYVQAMYFLEAAILVTKHCAQEKPKNPVRYSNFETVIVGTHHAFAAELLIKGIELFDVGAYSRGHNLYKLISKPECSILKARLESKFNSSPQKYCSEGFPISGSSNADNDFEYYLKHHSQNFEKMRYACEAMPPALDMAFTSFLCRELKEELRGKLGLE